MSYAKEKLGLAALKLQGRGSVATRFAKAKSDLSAVFETDIPKHLAPLFNEVVGAVRAGRGDHLELASELERLAAALD